MWCVRFHSKSGASFTNVNNLSSALMPLYHNLEAKLSDLQVEMESVDASKSEGAAHKYFEARSAELLASASLDEVPYVAFRIAELRRHLVIPEIEPPMP